MAPVVGRLRAPLREREELVADVDERHPAGATAQLELEQPSVERQRGVDVTYLQRDVIDSDEPGAGHAGSAPSASSMPSGAYRRPRRVAP